MAKQSGVRGSGTTKRTRRKSAGVEASKRSLRSPAGGKPSSGTSAGKVRSTPKGGASAAKKRTKPTTTRTRKRAPAKKKVSRAKKTPAAAPELLPGTRFLCKIVRKSLDLTQKEMAEFLGVSKKTVESYEQRWRATPVNVERLALLYLGCFKLATKKGKIECWRMTDCPKDQREACVVYKVKRGDLCWLFGGTMCGGERQTDWRAKLEHCTKCKVLRAVFE